MVNRVTVARFELEQASPNPATLKVVQTAFEAAGVEFRPNGSVGLREVAGAQAS